MTAPRQRLLILSFSHIVDDARVLKQVRLFSDEYEVTTCCYGPAPDGVAAHIELPESAVYWRYSRELVMLKQYRRAYWSNLAVSAATEALAGREFDIVLANDIDAVGVALRVAPRLGVHADLHEFAPRQKEELLRWRLFFAPFVRWMCRTFAARAKSVTTVGDGLARAYKSEFGITATTVTNASPSQNLDPQPVNTPAGLVHSGIAAPERQLEILVNAVTSTSADVTLDLILMPTDAAYHARLTALAEQSGGRVRVLDPVPNAQLVKTLNSYDVGLHVLPPTSFNNAWALPNKFFDYVQARLGLIIGPSPEMSAILAEQGFGATASDFTADALRAELDKLTPELITEWKQRSNAAAYELSAEQQVDGWRQAIEAIAEADAR